MRTPNYGIAEMVQNCIFVIKSRLLFKDSRLIRFPITIRGKKYIDFGKALTTGRYCRIEVNGIHDKTVISFGENVNIGDNVRVSACDSVTIGSNVLMGSKVTIVDNSHGSYSGMNQDSPSIPPNERPLHSAPIIIGDNVWIGEGVVIQKGVIIGDGSIIAANSVVIHSVPSNCIVGGASLYH